MTTTAKTTARVIGVAAGTALAIAFLVAGRVPPSGASLAAGLEVKAGRSAELAVTPSGRLLSAGGLRPGSGARPATARVSLWNPTDVMLAARPSVARGSTQLDDSLHVRVTADGRTLYEGTLGGLRGPTARSFRIAAGQRRRLSLAAWLPSSARGYEGRRTSVALELSTRVVSR